MNIDYNFHNLGRLALFPKSGVQYILPVLILDATTAGERSHIHLHFSRAISKFSKYWIVTI